MDFNKNIPKLSELKDSSPKAIARYLFLSPPDEPCSNQLLTFQDQTDNIYIFEILLIILLEGFNVLTNGFKNVNFDEFTEEHLDGMNPWFKSLGFKLKISSIDCECKEFYKEFFCRILLRNKKTESWFAFKNIQIPYTFSINGDYLQQNKNKKNLKDLYGIFILGNTVFKIAFDTFIPNIPINNK